jgi:intein/homing endonuclease
MADGSTKILQDIKTGDEVITVDPVSKQTSVAKVQALTEHVAKNYAITELLLIRTTEINTNKGAEINLHTKILKATPNHPVKTTTEIKQAGDIKTGDEVWCLNEQTNCYEKYTVWNKLQYAGGLQKVYNIIAESGETFIMNSVLVMQKQQSQ